MRKRIARRFWSVARRFSSHVRGEAMAGLVPAAVDRVDVCTAITRLKRLRANTSLGSLAWKELRDEGRR